MDDQQSEYKICPFCGEKIKGQAIKCRYCQSNLQMSKTDNSMLTATWVVLTIFFPIVGFVGGLIGLLEKREGAGMLFIFSICIAFIGIVSLASIL